MTLYKQKGARKAVLIKWQIKRRLIWLARELRWNVQWEVKRAEQPRKSSWSKNLIKLQNFDAIAKLCLFLDRGPERRESKLTVLCPMIIIILISYIIIYYIIIKLLIMENHPSQNRKRNSLQQLFIFFKTCCSIEAKF
jgi:hypothetical protein